MANGYPYLDHYKSLLRIHTNPYICENALKREFKIKTEEKIREAVDREEDSKLGTYFMINPNLKKPTYNDKLEFQRICITRYRTGSHNLLIEKGREGYFGAFVLPLLLLGCLWV